MVFRFISKRVTDILISSDLGVEACVRNRKFSQVGRMGLRGIALG